jgi:hypothetical protein
MLIFMRRIRIAVIGLLMLWLPLQAIAAVSMPFCAGGGIGSTAPASVHTHHQHDASAPASGHHGHQHEEGAASDGLQPCNNCGACNLACAPAVPISGVLPQAPALTAELHFCAQSLALFIPDQPQPPPNSRF